MIIANSILLLGRWISMDNIDNHSLVTPNGNEDDAFHLSQLSRTFATEGVVTSPLWHAVCRTVSRSRQAVQSPERPPA